MSANLTLRLLQGVPLTAAELDNNFTALNGIISDPETPATATGEIPVWNYETRNWKPSDILKVTALQAARTVTINAPENGLLVVGNIGGFNNIKANGFIYSYGASQDASNSIFGDNSFTLTNNAATDCAALGRSNFVEKTSGTSCTAVGYETCMKDISGLSNTGVGALALKWSASSRHNTAIGFQALTGQENASVGDWNTCIGRSAGSFITTGGSNTIIGSGVGDGLPSMNSTLIMYAGQQQRLMVTLAGIRTNGTASLTVDGALLSMGGGSLDTNFAGGIQSLEGNTIGNYNTAVGGYSLKENTEGLYNTALGYEALQANVNGQGSTAIGSKALRLAQSQAAGNIGIGWGAGESITTGTYNTVIGSSPGFTNMSGTVLICAGSTERIRVDAAGLLINEKPVPIYDLEIIEEGNTTNDTTPITFQNFIPTTVGGTQRWVGELRVDTMIGGVSAGIPISQTFILNVTAGFLNNDAIAFSGNGEVSVSGFGTPTASTPFAPYLPTVTATGNEFGIQLTITGQPNSGLCLQRATFRANNLNPV